MESYRIFCEDAHGKGFFEKLIEKLKANNKIPRTEISVKKHAGNCNSKLGRQLKAASDDFERVILLIDGDGKEKEEIKRKADSHILEVPSKYRHKLCTIILDFEIEEWICYALGAEFGYGRKPAGALNKWAMEKRRKNYEKHQLPQFVEEVDIEKLEKYPSFKEFLDALR